MSAPSTQHNEDILPVPSLSSVDAASQAVLARRKRRRPTPSQLQTLQEVYNCNPRPTSLQLDQLRQELGMPTHWILIWFQNRRYRAKMKSNRMTKDSTTMDTNATDGSWQTARANVFTCYNGATGIDRTAERNNFVSTVSSMSTTASYSTNACLTDSIPPQLFELYVTFDTILNVQPDQTQASVLVPVYRLLTPPIFPIKPGQSISLIAAFSPIIPTTATHAGIWESLDLHINGTVRYVSSPINGWIQIGIGNHCLGNHIPVAALLVPSLPSVVESLSTLAPDETQHLYDTTSINNSLVERTRFRPPTVGARCRGVHCRVSKAWLDWVQRSVLVLDYLSCNAEDMGNDSDGIENDLEDDHDDAYNGSHGDGCSHNSS
ncbi:hypothetical protein C8Q76DRAFT_690221 [Earliella scabrosa]|nr:hypothetical protein C8Q76DRAFT_690221 [Earliella scabrosa]